MSTTEQTQMNLKKIRNDFPILKQTINGHPLVYMDNAATSQKPTTVIESISNYYSEYNSNVHRGVHTLSQRATDLFEKSRDSVSNFISSESSSDLKLSLEITSSGVELTTISDDELKFSLLDYLIPFSIITLE